MTMISQKPRRMPEFHVPCSARTDSQGRTYYVSSAFQAPQPIDLGDYVILALPGNDTGAGPMMIFRMRDFDFEDARAKGTPYTPMD